MRALSRLIDLEDQLSTIRRFIYCAAMAAGSIGASAERDALMTVLDEAVVRLQDAEAKLERVREELGGAR